MDLNRHSENTGLTQSSLVLIQAHNIQTLDKKIMLTDGIGFPEFKNWINESIGGKCCHCNCLCQNPNPCIIMADIKNNYIAWLD